MRRSDCVRLAYSEGAEKAPEHAGTELRICGKVRCRGQFGVRACRGKRSVLGCAVRGPRSSGGWMARTGCASAAATCACHTAPSRRTRQVLPAYGLQDLPRNNGNPKPRSKPDTFPLPITLGGGHFYLAENRRFLLCIDTDMLPLHPRRPANTDLHELCFHPIYAY